ncbi:hypothetical protein CKO38_11190 [Rhodospirillum rubrum]|nr:hypothetical protein [Rhodospirillum rubrum]MBK1677218.1 hypothetical protein [Rhodospirillum rubrum]
MSISGRDPETSRRRLQQENIGTRRFQVSLGETGDLDTKSRAVSHPPGGWEQKNNKKGGSPQCTPMCSADALEALAVTGPAPLILVATRSASWKAFRPTSLAMFWRNRPIFSSNRTP